MKKYFCSAFQYIIALLVISALVCLNAQGQEKVYWKNLFFENPSIIGLSENWVVADFGVEPKLDYYRMNYPGAEPTRYQKRVS